ncbi:PucR family transcriptional regulator [Actinomadura parmotrematis]|uniref:Helix-turn-helix domain-containing protein n=1 Tax=Actinomadura parmotrematis TaxID=2864039 RepID=A0ABS7FY09_9ACTN|nr:helix-turn-helix domain-containing protein [Actinomadura parmotrematis]MBW8485191.1 helix-turn-helix domain-containing protein [Actinomadura parmotrematis]
MSYVADLLRSGSRIPLRLLAGPADATPLASVTAVETLDGLGRAPADALAVVTSRSAARAAGYQVDIAIRTAAERGVPALVLIGGGPLPLTATRLAARAGLAVLTAEEDCDVAELVLHLGQVIQGNAADSIARAHAALRAVRDCTGGVDELLHETGRVLGRTLTLSDDLSGPGDGEPVWVAGRRHGSVSGPPDDAVRLVLPAVAAAVGRRKRVALERATAPGQTRSDILTELIVAERARAGPLADRARTLGFAVDDVHTAVWIAPDRPAGADPAELAERRRLFDTLSLHAYQAPHRPDESWNLARLAADVVLVGSSRTEIREADARRMIDSLRGAVAGEHPGTVLRFGIGTPQRGIDGVRQTATEARAAASIAARTRETVRAFDATGINRILAGIAGSPLSRRVVDDLLAPLDALGPGKAAEAIGTLGAYLDARGSLKAAAARLRLHPNAVGYRIRKITERLGADLADPDTAFALHLACRVRLHD